MAKKSKAETTDPREWHKKVLGVFLDQVGAGEGLVGFTSSEIRREMKLEQGAPGFLEVAVAMTELRNAGFLAHKFSHEMLKEDFFEGDPTDIPNIQKRENEAKIRQFVFFVHPATLALGDEVGRAVDAGEFPAEFEYETNAALFTRESIREWYESLAEIIDLYVEDPSTAVKMISALMPVVE